jgi:trk system potassium uptake protein TrkA
MNIIITGAGKVGFNLAKKLSIAHNVTIIDINSEALHRIQENIDIMAIHGDVEDIKTYKEIKNRDIDLFIAVTNIDNTNLVSSLVADNILRIDKKIVRLKRESFNNQNIKDSFKIDKFICNYSA